MRREPERVVGSHTPSAGFHHEHHPSKYADYGNALHFVPVSDSNVVPETFASNTNTVPTSFAAFPKEVSPTDTAEPLPAFTNHTFVISVDGNLVSPVSYSS
jgi:hypothetical protein